MSVGSPADRAHRDDIVSLLRISDAPLSNAAADHIEFLRKEKERLRDGLQALHFPSDAPAGVLRSVAYDILMNGLDGDMAAYQIQRRTRLHEEKCEQLERVLQAANALAAHCARGVDVGPVSLAPATEAALWINLRNALDAAGRG